MSEPVLAPFGAWASPLGAEAVARATTGVSMVRLGPDGAERALGQPHVRPMDFTGRPMKGMVFVEPGGLHGAALREWVTAGAAFARALPPKAVAPRARTRR